MTRDVTYVNTFVTSHTVGPRALFQIILHCHSSSRTHKTILYRTIVPYGGTAWAIHAVTRRTRRAQRAAHGIEHGARFCTTVAWLHHHAYRAARTRMATARTVPRMS